MGSSCASCGHLITCFNATACPRLNFGQNPGDRGTTGVAVGEFYGFWKTTFGLIHQLVDGGACETDDAHDFANADERQRWVDWCGVICRGAEA